MTAIDMALAMLRRLDEEDRVRIAAELLSGVEPTAEMFRTFISGLSDEWTGRMVVGFRK